MTERCKAIKSDGSRCTRNTSVDSEYCWQHQPKPQPRFAKWLRRFTVVSVITVIVTLIGVYSDLISLGVPLPYISDQSIITDELEISRSSRIEDAPVSMSSTWKTTTKGTIRTAIVSHFWQLFLSNNGEHSMSVIDYNLIRVEDEESPILDYTGMDQGIFMLSETSDIQPVDFPINIEAGESVEVFVKVGVIMNPLSYQMVKDLEFDDEISLLEVNKILRSYRLDMFGNQLEEIVEGEGYKYPPFDEIKDEMFEITFRTSRQSSTKKTLSWYGSGGLYDEFGSRAD